MFNHIEINKNAYLHNVSLFRKLNPSGIFMAIVKSNAYGHGLLESIEILKGSADWYGVNSIAEASKIREIDAETPILVMGVEDPSEYSFLSSEKGNGVRIVLSEQESIEELKKRSPGTPFHLKVDTGMSRLGLHGRELVNIFQFLQKNNELRWEGLMSHFANVEDVTDQSYARIQLENFLTAMNLSKAAAGKRKIINHIAASAASLILPESRLDMIRVGISLYGFWPSRETRISAKSQFADLPELKPVMTWKSRLVHLNRVSADSCIGYGCTEKVVRDTVVGVVPVGYFEGYDRSLSNRGHILVNGYRARILGRVCMNMIMADVTHIPDVRKGDEAVLFGVQGDEEITADEIAGLAGTINYEIVSRIQGDIPRNIV